MRRDRGFTLMWALIVMALVGSLSAVTVTRIATMHGAMVTDEADHDALLAADGAIATARTALVTDPSWTGAPLVIGKIPVATSIARTAEGWTVTARAGGSVVLEATLVTDGTHPLTVTSWRRRR